MRLIRIKQQFMQFYYRGDIYRITKEDGIGCYAVKISGRGNTHIYAEEGDYIDYNFKIYYDQTRKLY